jgi:hypothetical protein
VLVLLQVTAEFDTFTPQACRTTSQFALFSDHVHIQTTKLAFVND